MFTNALNVVMFMVYTHSNSNSLVMFLVVIQTVQCEVHRHNNFYVIHSQLQL